MSRENLFIAALPGPECRDQLRERLELLRVRFPQWRFVKPVRWHMTLIFLGRHEQPDEACIDRARQVLGSIDAPAATASLDKVRALGHQQRPAVALACAEPPPDLKALHDHLSAELGGACAGHKTQYPFMPHVTMAYASSPLGESIEIPPVTFIATQLHLLRNVAGNPHYEVLASASLAKEKPNR